MNGTDDLVAFIKARLDEDEAAVTRYGLGERSQRSVTAKRKRLALMSEAHAAMNKIIADENADRADQAMAVGRARAATVAVKTDAEVYRDHPDYQARWKL